PIVDQLAGDRQTARKLGQVLAREPARVDQLGLLDAQVAADPARGEADHQRVRERPGLAREVRDLIDLDADLFLELAGDALLERLAGLDEAGEHAVETSREALRAREQDLVAAR